MGALTLTNSCLQDWQVQREHGYSKLKGAIQIKMVKMQIANAVYCSLLAVRGNHSHCLLDELSKKKKVTATSVNAVI